MAIGQTGEKSAAPAALLHISELKSPKNLGTVRPLAVTWREFVGRFRKARTADKGAAGAYVGARLKDGKRCRASLLDASLLSLDFDGGAVMDDVDLVLGCLPYSYLIYPSHNHGIAKDGAPACDRFRVVIPLSRPVSREEYGRLSRRLLEQLGNPEVDRTCLDEPERLFYYPTRPAGESYEPRIYDEDCVPLDVDAVLASCMSSISHGNGLKIDSNSKDDKCINSEGNDVISAFNGVFDIHEAIAEFLPETYVPCPERGDAYYTYAAGTTTGGLCVEPDGRRAYSHHSSDPARTGYWVNAFDLVRLHLFGELDKGRPDGTRMGERPSFRAMTEKAESIPAVREALWKARVRAALADFGSEPDSTFPAEDGRTSPAGTSSVRAALERALCFKDRPPSGERESWGKPSDRLVADKAAEWLLKAGEATGAPFRYYSETPGERDKANGFPVIFTGTHWERVGGAWLRRALSGAAGAVGFPPLCCRAAPVLDLAVRQFTERAGAFDRMRIPEGAFFRANLLNGTLTITERGETFEEHDPADGFRYVLPFEYDPGTGCPVFRKFFDRVLPQPDAQLVLMEHVAVLFCDGFKQERLPVLYGDQGANGKSTFAELVKDLVGGLASSFSLGQLTTPEKSWYRKELLGCLVNICSELDGVKSLEIFKQLASRECIAAEKKGGTPATMCGYARLLICTNSLRGMGQMDNAARRRVHVFPFTESIPEHEQDRQLRDNLRK